jgi:hypothetical protein
MLVVIRYLVLAASTVLILFVTGLALSVLWRGARPGRYEILIKPFVVVDEPNTLKNAENGFPEILAAKIADLQRGQIVQGRALLEQARSGESLKVQVGDSRKVPAEAGSARFASSTASGTSLARLPWPELHAASEPKLEFKVQGVDVSGLLSWIKGQVFPERNGLVFTMHVGGDGNVTVAGDVRDIGPSGENTLYLPPTKHSTEEALNDLALRLSQLRLAADEPNVADMPLNEFQELISHLSDAADKSIETQTENDRREHFARLSAYFSNLASERTGWQAVTILAAATARRAGDDEGAQKYLQLALRYEDESEPVDRDATRRRLIEATLVSITGSEAARARGLEVSVGSSERIVRHVISDNDTLAIEQLRSGS